MKPSCVPADEAERVRLLHGLGVLDTAAEVSFDTIARMASAQTGCPIGAVSFVDSQRQWFKASVGLGLAETPRRDAFCAHTILSHGLLAVRSEEHTSELQSLRHLVCRLLLEKKKAPRYSSLSTASSSRFW